MSFQSCFSKLKIKNLSRMGRLTSKRRAGSRYLVSTSEFLESRILLAGVSLTAREQLLLELINRARADPGAEATLYGIGLNDDLAPGTIVDSPKQPLAPSDFLLFAGRDHSDDMLTNNFFSHTGTGGTSPGDRATAAGYTWNSVGENIAWGGTTGVLDQDQAVYDRHEGLFKSAGHRTNILHADFREIGTAVRYGDYTTGGTTYDAAMVTELFGTLNASDFFITGVAYSDASDGSTSDDSFYSLGEAITSGTITATNTTTGTEYTTEIGVGGGYTLEVPDGTYNVSATGGGLGSTIYVVEGVVVGGENEKVDFETTTATTVTNSNPNSIAGFTEGKWWVSEKETTGWTTSKWATWTATTLVKTVQGDFDGDGTQDIAGWTDTGEWRVGISDGAGSFSYERWTQWRTTDIKEIHVGDFNNDGMDDIVALFKSGDAGNWWVAASTGSSFVATNWGAWGNYSGISDVVVGNFDGINGDDLAIMTTGGAWWNMLSASTEFVSRKWTTWSIGGGIDHIQVGDWDGNGKDDVAGLFGSGTSKNWWVGLSTGSAYTNRNWATWNVSTTLDGVLTGDFDGDGKDDLAGLFSGVNWWVSLAGTGGFVSTKWAQWTFATSGLSDLTVGDTNGDGSDDIIARDSSGLWRSGESTGTAFAMQNLSTWSTSATWSHVLIGNFLGSSSIPPADSSYEEDNTPLPFLTHEVPSSFATASFSSALLPVDFVARKMGVKNSSDSIIENNTSEQPNASSNSSFAMLEEEEDSSNLDDFSVFGSPELLDLLFQVS